MRKKVTTEDFISRAREIHGDKYDYSKVNYTDSRIKVCIICNECGAIFWQTPKNHLCGSGCPACGRKRIISKEAKSNEDFLLDCKRILGNGYSYDKTQYNGSKERVCITCQKHGDFWKFPCQIYSGSGCPTCKKEQTLEENKKNFFEKAKEVHGDKYSYEKSVYINSRTKIEIICHRHGSFWIVPNAHVNGVGCPRCFNEELRGKGRMLSYQDFIYQASIIHKNKYSYELINENNYIDTKHKVPIICQEHGVFWQTPHSHKEGVGCPHCPPSTISVGENMVREVLEKYNIEFTPQYKFQNDNSICSNHNFIVDFYLHKYNTIVEYNGQQHYHKLGYFGGEEKLKRTQDRDSSLRVYCKTHGIKLIEIPYTEFDNIETILTKELNIKKHD